LVALQREQVYDDLEALRRDSRRERTLDVVEVVDGTQVSTHLKATISQQCDHL
jgi:hypothetical protein